MTTQQISPPQPSARGRRRPRAQRPENPWAALPVVLAGTFMVVLDFFIVNVALPSMQADLHAGSGAIEWVVAGYALTSAIFLIPAGRLGDRIGRRRVFCLALALFSLASAACGAAQTPTELVIARLVQGTAGALMTPNILALIGVLFRGPDRARALSVYGLVMGLAAVGGQLIGGGLISLDIAHLAWRSCFLINVPIALVALAAAPRLIPESREATPPALDPVGIGLVTAAVTAIVLPLVDGRQLHWPLWCWLSLAAAPLLTVLLFIHQRRPAPRGRLIDLGLLADRGFAISLVAQVCFWAGQGAFFVVLALYLQQGRGLSAIDAGLVFTILAVAYLAASTLAPRLAAAHPRGTVIAGAAALSSGHLALLGAVLDIHTHGSIALLAPGLILAGVGMGLVIAPLATIALSALNPERAGAASGLLSTAQYVGSAIGVAITGVIYFGALSHGVAHAFELSEAQLAILPIGFGAAAALLPRR